MVPISALWHALITGLSLIWPSRLSLGGISLGDVWPCVALKNSVPKDSFEEGDDLVPFHKLTGWTTYSLIQPMERILGWQFDGIDDLTGLPEYRNGEASLYVRPSQWRRFSRLGSASRDGDLQLLPGGLFLDLGVLSIKKSSIPESFYPNKHSPVPKLPASHPAVVEWRAMTVVELCVGCQL